MHNRQSCCLHGLLADRSVLTSFCHNDVPAVFTTLTLMLIRLPSSCTIFLTFTASYPLGVVGTKITVSLWTVPGYLLHQLLLPPLLFIPEAWSVKWGLAFGISFYHSLLRQCIVWLPSCGSLCTRTPSSPLPTPP